MTEPHPDATKPHPDDFVASMRDTLDQVRRDMLASGVSSEFFDDLRAAIVAELIRNPRANWEWSQSLFRAATLLPYRE